MLSRTTRILLVAAVLAVGAYLLIERPHRENSHENAFETSRLAHFDLAAVDTVVIERSNDTLRFVYADSLWRMTRPLYDTAELSAVESLLDALQRAQINRNLGPATSLAQYGLDRPIARVTLLTARDTLMVLSVGKRTVDDAWCFARTRASDVILIPTGVARAAALPRDAYRSQRVVDFQLADIGRYSVVRNTGEGMSWARGRRGWYAKVAPGDTVPGDSVAVEALLRRLRGLRVARFLDARSTQTSNMGAIELWHTGEYPLASLLFKRIADDSVEVVEPMSGRAVVVADNLDDLFSHTTTDLRDRRLLQFDPSDATKMEFVLPGLNGSLVRTAGQWAFPNPSMGAISPERAAQLVRALRALKWTEPAAQSAGGDTRFHVLIHGADGAILDEMRVTPVEGTSMWPVTSRSSGGAWLVEKSSLDRLVDLFQELKGR